jgi:hypothetical protein
MLHCLLILYGIYYSQKHKGTEGLIHIENPNLVKAKNVKAKEVDVSLS